MQQWLEVYEERGENTASLGIIQLIFDKLKESCSNNSMRHASIPDTIDLRTFNLEEFVRTRIRGKVKHSYKKLMNYFRNCDRKIFQFQGICWRKTGTGR